MVQHEVGQMDEVSERGQDPASKVRVCTNELAHEPLAVCLDAMPVADGSLGTPTVKQLPPVSGVFGGAKRHQYCALNANVPVRSPFIFGRDAHDFLRGTRRRSQCLCVGVLEAITQPRMHVRRKFPEVVVSGRHCVGCPCQTHRGVVLCTVSAIARRSMQRHAQLRLDAAPARRRGAFEPAPRIPSCELVTVLSRAMRARAMTANGTAGGIIVASISGTY